VGVLCGPAPDLSKVVVPSVGGSIVDPNLPVPVDRMTATRVWLNASTVSNPKGDLLFKWRILSPTVGSRNPIDGEPLPVPSVVDSESVVASFLIPQAGVDYVVELSVNDHCSTTVKTFTVRTQCALQISLANKTLAAYYDGQVPVTLMSFAYDHTQEVATVVPYPKCQKYTWKLVDYASDKYSDSLLGTTDAEFSKTGGFAALISIVVIIAVIVPLVIWMYCTKKACFNKTDPRV
jgi:hypothetical protein